MVLLTDLNGCGKAYYDPYNCGSRTLEEKQMGRHTKIDKQKKDVTMEDISGILLDILDNLKDHQHIFLTSLEEDKLWDILSSVLDKFFDYPEYNNYN